MTLPVVLRPEAEADILEAYQWHSERMPGLGDEFLRSVDAAMASIERSPEIHAVVHEGIRRALLRKFPYGLFYLIEEDRIVVLACFHARRDPRAWRERT